MNENQQPKTYSNVVSLGYFCSVSMELERIGLRNCSLPFDWLISANYKKVLENIGNHFAEFLCEENLYQEKSINSKYYYDDKNEFHFYHDFSKYTSLEEQLPQVKEKYNRRIFRFYETVKNPTLFIRYCGSKEELEFIQTYDEEIRAFFKAFHPANDVIYITNSKNVNDSFRLTSSVYTVQPDENDFVAREFLKQCPELEQQLLRTVDMDTERNRRRYHRNQAERFLAKIQRKVNELNPLNKAKIYNHSRQI